MGKKSKRSSNRRSGKKLSTTSNPVGGTNKACCTTGNCGNRCTCQCHKCTGVGWMPGLGGGSQLPEKIEGRDARRWMKADRGFTSGVDQDLIDAVKDIDMKDDPFLLKALEDGSISQEEADRICQFSIKALVLLGTKWDAEMTSIVSHEENGRYKKAEAKATAMLTGIKNLRMEYGVTQKHCISMGLPSIVAEKNAFGNRAELRLYNLGNAQGAMEDFTQAMLLHHGVIRRGLTEVDPTLITFMFRRAMCHKELGNIDACVVDLKACCSGVRSLKGGWPMDEGCGYKIPKDAVQELLLAMAKQKLRDNNGIVQRPMLTIKEKEKLERDLGLNAFDPDVHQCLMCSKPPSSTTDLLRCSRCEEVWFCSKECQLQAHKNYIHRGCTKPAPIVGMTEAIKANLDTEWTLYGVAELQSSKGQPKAILWDPKTGRYFDFVTNYTYFPMPSEQEEYLAAFNEHQMAMGKPPFAGSGLSIMDRYAESVRDLGMLLEAEEFTIVEKKTTHQLKEPKKMLDLLMVTTSGNPHKEHYMFKHQLDLFNAYQFRSRGRYRMGNFPSAARDASDALVAMQALRITLRALEATGSCGKNCPPTPFIADVYEEQELLFIRGQSLRHEEDFAGSISDLRKCYDLAMSHGSSRMIIGVRTNLGPQLDDIKAYLLLAMAIQKVHEAKMKGPAEPPIINTAGETVEMKGLPNYTDEEAQAIEKDLQLGMFRPEKYHCASCNAVPSKTLSLELCPKCQQWFCALCPEGKQHKSQCNVLNWNLFGMPVSTENMGDYDKWAFEKYGVFQVNVDGENRAFIKVDRNNAYDSITMRHARLMSPGSYNAFVQEMMKSF